MPITLMGLDPLSFMTSYRAQLNFESRSGETKPIDDCVAGPFAKTKQFPTGQRFTIAVTASGTAATIKLNRQAGAWETGVRYLPWEPDVCTYMIVDGAAEICFTGPLTGCNIYVAGPPASPVLFHTNSNTNATDAAANNTVKRALAMTLLGHGVGGLANTTVISGELERATYSGNFLGFVFGLKHGTDWRFYFNGIGADAKTVRRIY